MQIPRLLVILIWLVHFVACSRGGRRLQINGLPVDPVENAPTSQLPPCERVTSILSPSEVLIDPTDRNKFEITSHSIRLTEKDQTDDTGDQGGFGGGLFLGTEWNNLSHSLEMNQEGKIMQLGSFTSRLLDAGGEVIWNEFRWIPQRPYLKELPDRKGSEMGHYREGGINMAENALLFHFNERTDPNLPATFIDSSGNNLHGTFGVAAPTSGIEGQFGLAVSFDGTNNIKIQDSPLLRFNNSFSLSAWVKRSGPAVRAAILTKTSAPEWTDGFGLYDDELGNICFFFNSTFQVNHQLCTPFPTGDFFQLVTVTYDGSTLRLFANGLEAASTEASGNILNSANGMTIGKTKGGLFWTGKLDELALWSRVLSPEEIFELYHRGTVRLKFQIAVCNEPAQCQESFRGPSGPSSYYSELQNHSNLLPTLPFREIGRYLQYRAFFETESSTLFPMLHFVSLGPRHYDAGSPSIVAAVDKMLSALLGVKEVAPSASSDLLTVQLSSDSRSWFYHDGAQWAPATNPIQSNRISLMNSILSERVADFLSGSIFLKIFFNSKGGESSVELNPVELLGIQRGLSSDSCTR